MIKALYERVVKLLDATSWLAPLLVRLVVGIAFFFDGKGKLAHLDNVTKYFTSLHIPAPHANAVFVSVVELVGGALLVVGLATRVAALFLIGTMAVALWTAILPGLRAQGMHGFDLLVGACASLELTYIAVFVWLAWNGAGDASIDRVLAGRTRT
jgi:putative oxidoreductase